MGSIGVPFQPLPRSAAQPRRGGSQQQNSKSRRQTAPCADRDPPANGAKDLGSTRQRRSSGQAIPRRRSSISRARWPTTPSTLKALADSLQPSKDSGHHNDALHISRRALEIAPRWQPAGEDELTRAARGRAMARANWERAVILGFAGLAAAAAGLVDQRRAGVAHDRRAVTAGRRARGGRGRTAPRSMSSSTHRARSSAAPSCSSTAPRAISPTWTALGERLAASGSHLRACPATAGATASPAPTPLRPRSGRRDARGAAAARRRAGDRRR